MSPDIEPPQKKKIVGYKDILVNPDRGDIARTLQLFHNYSYLCEDNFYHFNIIGDILQLYLI